jgi:hydroxyethylthiazole kinase-like uncharacterized protein yjeF
MENAARGCADLLEELAAAEPRLLTPPYQLVCGPGNNGGDGFALARHLHNRGYEAVIHLVEPRERLGRDSDALSNLRIAERMGLDIRGPAPGRPLEQALQEATASGILVDAMLGTGLTRALRSPYREWAEALNRSERPVVAIDIPTGLDADTGQVLGAAVEASFTLTMAAPKLGFARAEGPRHTGRVLVVEIGIPRELMEKAVAPPPAP